MTCHCGSPMGNSDHCPFCGCEEFEGTCDEKYVHDPKVEVSLRDLVKALRGHGDEMASEDDAVDRLWEVVTPLTCLIDNEPLVTEPGGDDMPTIHGRTYCPKCQERLHVWRRQQADDLIADAIKQANPGIDADVGTLKSLLPEFFERDSITAIIDRLTEERRAGYFTTQPQGIPLPLEEVFPEPFREWDQAMYERSTEAGIVRLLAERTFGPQPKPTPVPNRAAKRKAKKKRRR